MLNGDGNNPNGGDVRILSDSDMPSAYVTDNQHDPVRVEISDANQSSGLRPVEAAADPQGHEPAVRHQNLLSVSQERERQDARYTTDCIQEVPESARSRDFNQETDRQLMAFPREPTDEGRHAPVNDAILVETEIDKYDRAQEDKEETQSDVFKQYCEATCFDERVAIQQGYIQRHTPYGERVKQRDVLMMKQLPRLKEHLYP